MSPFDRVIQVFPMVMALHGHACTINETSKQDQKYQNIIHNSMSMTKESNSKIHDYNISYFMGKEPNLH